MAKQTTHGKAFEYACASSLYDEVRETGDTASLYLAHTPALSNAKRDFESLPPKHRDVLASAGLALTSFLRQTEPRLFGRQSGFSSLHITIQSDSEGMKGDVRDILASGTGIDNSLNWEIGISSKHNHDAVKHPRLSKSIDIGMRWMGLKCDDQYWHEIEPVFDLLERYKGLKGWEKVGDKESLVYVPLLNAVMGQISRLYERYGERCPQSLLHYLIGKDDFYKAIVRPSERQLEVQAFNFNGTLNQSFGTEKPQIRIPVLRLPTKLHDVSFAESSRNTIHIVMDEGWQVSMRIHNASSRIEASLKMDVRLIGVPPGVFKQTIVF